MQPRANRFEAVFVLPAIAICFACTTVSAKDKPTASGILRLTRGWEVGKPAQPGEDASGHFKNRIDFDRPPTDKNDSPGNGPVILHRRFRAPSNWQGRKVWLTYDARRMSSGAPHSFLLNDHRLPLRSLAGEGAANEAVAGSTPEPVKSWFVEIGSFLRFDQDNMLEFRTSSGIPNANAGFWLYCRPPREEVLFLASTNLSDRELRVLGEYASAVEKALAIRVHVESRSFRNPKEMQAYLRDTCARRGISGMLLIGNHPIQVFDHKPDYIMHPRFYEDLDALWRDSDGDGDIDDWNTDAGYGCEIWSSWIRKLPDRPELMEPFFKKCIRYFRGEMIFPGKRVILPRADSTDAGLDHVDLFMRPGAFACYGTHGGTIHGKGPQRIVSQKMALQFYPGSLVTLIGGCRSGDITTNPKLKPAEAYVFGRSNGLVSFGSGGGIGGPNRVFHSLPGVQEELARIAPHIGIYYQYIVDMAPDNAIIMFGSPFVDFERVAPAAGATVAGKILTQGNSELDLGTFYVSALHNGECFGRVRVAADGQYRIECLPRGEYEMRCHLNPLEYQSKLVTLSSGQSVEMHWSLQALWTLRGKILDAHGRAEKRGWVEVATEPTPELFDAGQIYGVRADEAGSFQLHGTRSSGFFVRARSGFAWVSEPQPINFGSDKKPMTTVLRMGFGERIQRSKDRGPTFAALLESKHSFTFANGVSDSLLPEVDVTDVFLALIPATSKTVPVGMRKTGSIHGDSGRTEHQLRLGFRLADALDREGADKRQCYEWTITGVVNPVTARVLYDQKQGRWKARLIYSDRRKRPRPFWDRVMTFVRDDWVFIDIVPTAKSEHLKFQLFLQTTRGIAKTRLQDSVPSLNTIYYVEADMGNSSKLVVREAQSPNILEQPERTRLR
jgi:hypothetical protein